MTFTVKNPPAQGQLAVVLIAPRVTGADYSGNPECIEHFCAPLLEPRVLYFYFVFRECSNNVLMYYIYMGNCQKRELPRLFGQKRMYSKNHSGRECCWPYLIGQHPLSPVFGQKRPGTPGNSYFAQLPPVFGHFITFLSGGLLDCARTVPKPLSRVVSMVLLSIVGLYL